MLWLEPTFDGYRLDSAKNDVHFFFVLVHQSVTASVFCCHAFFCSSFDYPSCLMQIFLSSPFRRSMYKRRLHQITFHFSQLVSVFACWCISECFSIFRITAEKSDIRCSVYISSYLMIFHATHTHTCIRVCERMWVCVCVWIELPHFAAAVAVKLPPHSRGSWTLIVIHKAAESRYIYKYIYMDDINIRYIFIMEQSTEPQYLPV